MTPLSFLPFSPLLSFSSLPSSLLPPPLPFPLLPSSLLLFSSPLSSSSLLSSPLLTSSPLLFLKHKRKPLFKGGQHPSRLRCLAKADYSSYRRHFDVLSVAFELNV